MAFDRKEYYKKYYLENKARYQQYAKEYRKKNLEKLSQYNKLIQKKYKKKNLEKYYLKKYTLRLRR
jgi:hypothetical protein